MLEIQFSLLYDLVVGDKIQIGKYSIYVVEIREKVKGKVVLQVKVLN
jgi:hypothetical protein